MPILRKNKKERYTVIDNAVFLDKELSLKAKGILCQMLSLPNEWSFSIEGLTALAKDGKASVMSALNELEEAGYFRREQLKEDGRFAGVEYIVSETKMSDFPYAEIQNTEIRNTGNPPLLNTKELNTNESITKDIHSTTARRKSKCGNLHSNASLRPTLEEIDTYVKEKCLDVDARFFYDFFTAGEWIDSGGRPVRNWKQKLLTWSKQNRGRRSENTRARGQSTKTEQKDYGDFSDFAKIDI